MICWFCWCIWCSFMFTFDFFDTHWSIWQCQVFFMFFISLCIYVIYAIIWFIFLFDYLIYLIIWFVWYDCDIMLFVVDVCACVEMLNELMYPENSQKKTRLKLLTGRFHPYSPATMPDETMERLTRRRLGYFEAAVLNDEAEFGPAVNARRWPHGQSWPVLESWDSHLIMCKGWPASHFFGQSLCTHQMINAIMQGQYMMYMTVFFDILIILYFLLLLILLHPFWSFYLFFNLYMIYMCLLCLTFRHIDQSLIHLVWTVPQGMRSQWSYVMASLACHTDHPASTLVIWCMEKHEKQRLWGCLICLGFLGQWRMWRYINYINNVNLCKVHKVHKIYRFYQRYRKYVKVNKIYKIIRYIRLYKIYKKYKLYIKYINPEYW